MRPAIGMRFGRYELVDWIGAGGMGEVYLARDHDLGRDVAIKFLPERFASDPVRLARFAQEARTASSLNHPNIVTIHEIGQTSGLPYIVMERVDGDTLRDLLRGGPLAPRRALDIAAQVAEGLAKAHQAGIVHRDLKPENIMVTGDGFAKILDFGLAKFRADVAEGSGAGGVAGTATEADTCLSPNTAAGVVLGTAGYMAPEQTRGEAADQRSDQFALGAILYEMATGRRAFHRSSVVQTLAAIIESEPEPIGNLNPSFPAPARWAVERCLAKEPGSRYVSTVDLARELRSVREHIVEATSSASGQAPVVLPRRRPWPWGLGVAVVVVLASVFLTSGTGDRVLRWLRPPLFPAEIRLAVLLDAAEVTEQDRERLSGLLDYVVIRLADVNRVRSTVSVVPASEVREAGLRSSRDAGRRVGATLAVSLRVYRAGQNLVVSVSLEDATNVRVLGGDQRTFKLETFSEDEIVDLIVGLLRLELAAKERAAWTAGGTGVVEARALFASGLNQTPYQLAQTSLEKYDQEQDVQRAIDFFNRAIALDPRYADAYAKLGEAYLWRYRLARRPEYIALAEQNAERARSLDDTRPATWITLGMIYAQKGDVSRAEAAFGSAIDRNPRDSLARRELGRVYQRAGRSADAEASYRKAIEIQPDSWSNHSHLAVFLLGVNRLEEAEAEARAAIRAAPDNVRAWSNLGVIHSLQKRYDEAERDLHHAVALRPYGPALSNLATLQFRVRRQFAESARTSERATQVAPRDYRIWRNLAAALYWVPGERDRATGALRKAVAILDESRKIDPTNPEILVQLADSHAMLGEAPQARAFASDAVKLAPADGDVAALAAGAYETIGDRDAALRHVAVALGKGVDRFEFESDPTFDRLVKDARYAAIVKAVPDLGRQK